MFDDKNWYYFDEEENKTKKLGSQTMLRDLWEQGKISSTTRIYDNNLRTWTILQETDELWSILPNEAKKQEDQDSDLEHNLNSIIEDYKNKEDLLMNSNKKYSRDPYKRDQLDETMKKMKTKKEKKEEPNRRYPEDLALVYRSINWFTRHKDSRDLPSDTLYTDSFNMLVEAQSLVDNKKLPVFSHSKYHIDVGDFVEITPLNLMRDILISQVTINEQEWQVYKPAELYNETYRSPSKFSEDNKFHKNYLTSYGETAYSYYLGAVLMLKGKANVINGLGTAEIVSSWRKVINSIENKQKDLIEYLDFVKRETQEEVYKFEHEKDIIVTMNRYVKRYWDALIVTKKLLELILLHMKDNDKFYRNRTLDKIVKETDLNYDFVLRVWNYLLEHNVFTFDSGKHVANLRFITSSLLRDLLCFEKLIKGVTYAKEVTIERITNFDNPIHETIKVLNTLSSLYVDSIVEVQTDCLNQQCLDGLTEEEFIQEDD